MKTCAHEVETPHTEVCPKINGPHNFQPVDPEVADGAISCIDCGRLVQADDEAQPPAVPDNFVPWACPRCGAKANAHGRGGSDKCQDQFRSGGSCQGFLCECEDETDETHGNTPDSPCTNPVCHHCGWNIDGGAIFPAGAVDPRKLRGWAKTAWESGWRPPAGWAPAPVVKKSKSKGD